MKDTKNRILPIQFLLFTIMFVFVHISINNKINKDTLSELNNWIIKKIMENYEDGTITASDIVVGRSFHGSFSRDNVNEVFVLCKILNTPHVAGTDKKVGILIDSISLEIIAYKEFPSDKTVVDCVQTSNGRNRIVAIRTAQSTGMSVQYIELWAVEGSQWIEIPIDTLKIMEEDDFYFWGDDMLIVSSDSELKNSEQIKALLIWNPKTEQFELK